MWARVRPVARVLRLGMIRDGVLGGERVLRSGESLKGAALGGLRLGARGADPVLHDDGRGWVLRVPAHASGRVQWDGGGEPLERLGELCAGVRVLRVQPGWRGKVHLEGVTLLFQELPAPAEQDLLLFRPALFEPDDRPFTHALTGFGLAFTLFGVWAVAQPERAVLAGFELNDLPPSVVAMAQLPPPQDPPPAAVERPQEVAGRDVARRRERPEPSPAPEVGPAPQAGDPLAQVEAQSALLALIGHRGPDGGGLRVVDRLGSEAVERELERLLAQRTGAEIAQADGPVLKGEPVRRGAEDIGALRSEPVPGSSAPGEAPAVRVRGQVEEPPEGPGLGSADPTGASAMAEVIRRNRGSIQYCYEAVLREDPEAGGRVELFFVVENGEVEQVDLLDSAVEHPGFAACLERQVRRWQFPAGVSGAAEYPFVLRPATP